MLPFDFLVISGLLLLIGLSLWVWGWKQNHNSLILRLSVVPMLMSSLFVFISLASHDEFNQNLYYYLCLFNVVGLGFVLSRIGRDALKLEA
ncbi:MAG: hypothetical protein ABJ275_11775 [Maricaulaceae bacterium]